MPRLARVQQWDRAGSSDVESRAANVHPLRYYAFLSYSHADEATASWLHDALERFRTPSSLAGRLTDNGAIPKRLTPIFRDRHELAASANLASGIREALDSSRFLVVLCSPAAAASHWVNAEIDMFKRHRPDGCVLAAIVAGDPFASEVPGHEGEECFPPALRQRYDRRGRPTGKRAEPLAADLRDDRDGKRLGLLKLIAGMLGVGLDELVQRETLRRQRRLAIVAAASLAGMAVTSTLAVVALESRDDARDQRREAEGLVGFMLGDLRSKLEPIGRLDALDAVGARALAYFQKQEKSELSDEALAQRSRALTLMGEIANRRGDLDRALAHYREALAGTAEALRRDPDDAQRIFDHAQNVFWVGAIAYQRGSPAQAERAWREYKRLAEQLVGMDPAKKEWRLERIYADTNLGIVLLDEDRYREAAETFARGLKDVESLAAAEPANRAYQDQLSEALAWLSEAREGQGALDEALGHSERQLALLEQHSARGGADAPMKRKMMVAHRAIGRLFAQRGDAEQGLEHLQASVRLANQLMQTEPESSEWAETGAGAYLDLGELQLAAGRNQEAGASARTGCNITNRLIARDSTVVAWRSTLRRRCLALRAWLALSEGAVEEARALSSQAAALAQAEAARSQSREARFALADARLLRGEVAQAMREPQLAQSHYRSALSVFPQRVELTPRLMSRKLLILEGLGLNKEAGEIASKLNGIGYRHPGFLREQRLING
jgi:tetratricopeptide (TPR) repeat protein